VLSAHGSAVSAHASATLLAGWAAAGYVVAGPTYPLLSGVPAGPSHADYEQAFTDSSFVIDRVLEQSARPGNLLTGLVDPTRIGAAGHSDGEVIAFGLAYFACCRDTRIRSVAAFAGNLENIGANEMLHGIGVPVLHATGERDEFDSYSASIAWDRAHLEPPRWITTLRNASHSPPFFDAQSPWFGVVSRATIAFFDGTLKDNAARLDAVAEEIAMHPDLASLER
jgi:predicted dienelactone hydrolase